MFIMKDDYKYEPSIFGSLYKEYIIHGKYLYMENCAL